MGFIEKFRQSKITREQIEKNNLLWAELKVKYNFPDSYRKTRGLLSNGDIGVFNISTDTKGPHLIKPMAIVFNSKTKELLNKIPCRHCEPVGENLLTFSPTEPEIDNSENLEAKVFTNLGYGLMNFDGKIILDPISKDPINFKNGVGVVAQKPIVGPGAFSHYESGFYINEKGDQISETGIMGRNGEKVNLEGALPSREEFAKTYNKPQSAVETSKEVGVQIQK